MVEREILEDQLAILQELQAGLVEKVKKPVPGHVYETYTTRIMELSKDIQRLVHDIRKSNHIPPKKENVQR